ncbi:DUF6891 domain-containing protein [Micromonospora sp. GCM10011542]|uniref:DUF6891 domain-containing protein n=1 Tax=Micromonospora sp. GCM10011542 TaxID=3317337 RepID=UPI0036235657
MEPEEQELDEQIRNFVRRQVALAELPAAAIAGETVAYLKDEASPAEIEARAWPVVIEELTRHLAEQAHWPEVTDSDRLTAAFRALTAAGVVAREDFTCCQNCGVHEIGADVPRTIEPRGYAFYHRQDAERVAAGSPVFVNYGAFDGATAAEIGAEVANALRAEGLTVHWNGDTASRIQVPMAWRRRRVGRLAAVPPTPDDDVEVDVELLGGWAGPHSPGDGPASAGRLTALHLPWLPAAVRVRLSWAGRSVEVRREGDTLVGTYAEPGGPELTVGRYDGTNLVRRLRGLPPGAVPDRTPAGFVEVNADHVGGADRGVPMDLAEVLVLLRGMRPLSYDFLTCVGRSGGCVQTTWEPKGLWVEELDTTAVVSVGRFATLTEVEQVLTTLAMEDRVAVRELGGHLTTLHLG